MAMNVIETSTLSKVKTPAKCVKMHEAGCQNEQEQSCRWLLIASRSIDESSPHYCVTLVIELGIDCTITSASIYALL